MITGDNFVTTSDLRRSSPIGMDLFLRENGSVSQTVKPRQAHVAWQHMAAGIGHSDGRKNWLGWKDSNLRMAVPKTAALPLGYTPRPWGRCIARPMTERKSLMDQTFALTARFSPSGFCACFHGHRQNCRRQGKCLRRTTGFPAGQRFGRISRAFLAYLPDVVHSFKKVTFTAAKFLRDESSFAK